MTFALPPVRTPFPVTAPHRVVPSLRPLGSAPHVVLDASYAAVLARKVARLAGEPELCRVRDPADPDDSGLEAALLEALTVLARDTPEAVRLDGDWAELPGLGIALHVLGGTRPRVEKTGPGWPVLGDLAAAARVHLAAVADAGSPVALLADTVALAGIPDWTVLRRRARGALAAELLAVCLPSSWSPRDRAGADHVALHAPVGDNARLLAAGPALSEALLTKGPFLQYAWTVAPDDRLDLDPAAGGQPGRPAATTSPAEWYLRVERQTSVPLPALGRALFTIQLSLTPLTEVARDPDRARMLADALATMSPATLAYKGLTEAHSRLVAWLRTSAPQPPGRTLRSR